jgi:hypothetical protein
MTGGILMPALSDRLSNLVRVVVTNRRAARRVLFTLPVRFAVLRTSKAVRAQRSRSVTAYTYDLSRTGISLETSLIQIDSFHVSLSADMASEQLLEIEMELPGRVITVYGLPLRYERRRLKHGNYIVGVKITSMSDEDRVAYEQFLKAAERRH